MLNGARKSLGTNYYGPRYFVGNGTNWNSTTSWSTRSGGPSGASIPQSFNDVVFDGNSPGGVTITVAAVCRSLDFTGGGASNYTHTLTYTSGGGITIGCASANGTLAAKFNSSMTLTGSMSLTFVSTAATQVQFTSAGKTFNNVSFNGVGGSWILEDNLTLSNALSVLAGAFATNDKTITALAMNSNTSSTRSISLGASAINLSGSGVSAWQINNATGITVNAGTSTITLSGAAPNFSSVGFAYHNVVLSGTGTYTMGGNNSFNNLTRSNAAACGLQISSGTTQTVTGTLTLSGASSGALMSLTASSSGTAATISVPSGTVTENFMSIKDSTATGGATFHAGAGSTNVSGNTGWIFP